MRKFWDGFVQWFCYLMCLGLVCRVVMFLYHRSPLVFLYGLALPAIILGVWGLVLCLRKWRGYYVSIEGNGEGGVIIYCEGKNEITLAYESRPFCIRVPSAVGWQRTKPEWAKERQAEIMRRVKREFPKALYRES